MEQLTDARADQLGNACGGAGELVRVAEHDVEVTRLGGVDEVPGILRRENHRLLEHHVEAGAKRRLGERIVVDVGNGDHHAIDEP